MMPGLAGRAAEQAITTAATIAPTRDVVILSGTTSIATITPPPTGGISDNVLVLIPTGGDVALLTTGNIAVAVTMTSLKSTWLIYSQSQSKWYPNV